MGEPVIVVVNGLPGSGKTSVARGLGARLERCAVLEGDWLQHHVTVSGLVGPGEEPQDESWRQLVLRWRNLASLATNFADDGFSVVVDSLCIPELWQAFCRDVAPRPVRYLHLDPRREVGLARDAARGHRAVGARYDFVAEQFAPLRGLGPWIDSSEQTLEQTVDEAVRVLGL